MTDKVQIQDISSGYRTIKDGTQFNKYFGAAEDRDRIIIEDGDVFETVDLMKRVVWKYIDDTKQIAEYLRGNNTAITCSNVWDFLYHHIQYRLDKQGVEELRRPNRSWSDRHEGIDCDCFSIFVSSILTNLQIPHEFRITKYNTNSYQHVYVIVPQTGAKHITVDCVLQPFNYEKPYSHKKDFTMNLEGINVAVLSGFDGDVLDLVQGLEELDGLSGADQEQVIFEHLVKTRSLITSDPSLIENVDYPPAFIKMLDYAIENWHTPNREKALAILAKNEDAYNALHGLGDVDDEDEFEDEDDDDFEDDDELFGEELGRARRKRSSRSKRRAKRKSRRKRRPKKGFFKKVGKALKKGGKLFMRFNPVTAAARGGFLLAMKMNLKKIASNLKWAYATKAQAKKKGISEKRWNRAKNGLKKIEKLFTTIGGRKKALKKAITKGKAGGLNGEIYDDGLEGLGFVSAASISAAIPIIGKAIKMLVDSGIMKKKDAKNIEAELKKKVAEGGNLVAEIDDGKEGGASGSPSDDGL